MADGQLIGHAHAAVQLDGLLADIAAGSTDERLRRRYGLAALECVGLTDSGCGEIRRGTRLLDRDRHVRDAMLQGLKSADGAPELGARPQILGSDLEQFLHAPHRLGAQCSDACIYGELKRLITLIDGGDHVTRTQSDILEGHFRRTLPVDVGKALDADAGGLCIDQKQCDAAAIIRRAAGTRRYDQGVGAIAVEDD